MLTGLTSKEIIANCLLFFFAGYETTAASLSFLAYNLALNPDIQQKMYEEIVSVLGEVDKQGEKNLALNGVYVLQ